MKELILIALAVLVSVNLWAVNSEYCEKSAELASIERITAISNGICNDAINNELGKLSNEQLAEVLGL